MLINDYNNLTGISPLKPVVNDKRFIQERNFDPKKCFDPELLNIARECAAELPNMPEI